MKELTIEQKAQRYDEAKVRMSRAYNDNRCTIGFMNEIFPEFKESEDERIELLNYLYDVHDNDEERTRWIAWLEKQAEHAKFRDSIQVGDKVTRNEDGVLVNLSQLKRVAKPAENKGEHDMGISEATKQELEDNLNKALEKETPESCNEFLEKQAEQKPTVETKLKIEKGKWYICISQFCNCIEGRAYKATSDSRLVDDFGTEYDMHSDAYKYFRLWTTQDAKDGDVLAIEPIEGYHSPFVAIYKKQNEEDFDSHCFIGFDGKFYKRENGHSTEEIHPATKEQRDLLFQKMKEADYEWDAEKKELRKIEKKPVWSEEDENRFNNLIFLVECSKEGENTKQGFIKFINRLKSLKDRVQPQQQEWSKEDDYYYGIIQYILNNECVGRADKENAINWLKSLKNRYTWKPSDEQIKALANALSLAKNCGEESAFDLRTLYEQIKKLTE